jgi:hypothetical protein
MDFEMDLEPRLQQRKPGAGPAGAGAAGSGTGCGGGRRVVVTLVMSAA